MEGMERGQVSESDNKGEGTVVSVDGLFAESVTAMDLGAYLSTEGPEGLEGSPTGGPWITSASLEIMEGDIVLTLEGDTRWASFKVVAMSHGDVMWTLSRVDT